MKERKIQNERKYDIVHSQEWQGKSAAQILHSFFLLIYDSIKTKECIEEDASEMCVTLHSPFYGDDYNGLLAYSKFIYMSRINQVHELHQHQNK